MKLLDQERYVTRFIISFFEYVDRPGELIWSFCPGRPGDKGWCDDNNQGNFIFPASLFDLDLIEIYISQSAITLPKTFGRFRNLKKMDIGGIPEIKELNFQHLTDL